MTLKDWMRIEGVSDDAMAGRIGGISRFMVRALRFRVRGPSIRVAARIAQITAGRVMPPDLVPLKPGVREPARPARHREPAEADA